MNLYRVSPCEDWCLFVFAESRNKAKAMCVNWFTDGEAYVDMRIKTLARDVGGKPEVVDDFEHPSYGRVDCLGFGFTNGDEEEEP